MKTLSVFFAGALLGTALAIGAFGMTGGATPATLNSTQSDVSVSVFWEKFKTAVIKSDKETVAALTRFPVARGYGLSSLKSKAQLMRRFRELFFGETNAAQCFPQAKPVVEKERPREFTISCPFARDGGNEEPFIYTFTRTRTGWKFTGFENVNE